MKKIKTLFLGLIATLGLTGCGIGGWVNDRVCEQKVEFYEVVKDSEANIGEAAISDGKDVHLALVWNAANQFASKFEQKATSFKAWISNGADPEAKLGETAISLKSKDHEQTSEVITIDPFVEGDEDLFKPYKVTVGNKYTGDSDGNLALKVSVNLPKLYEKAEINSDVFEAHFRILTGFGARSTIDWKYEKVSETEFKTYYKESKLLVSGAKTEFMVGDEFSTEGLAVEVAYENAKLPHKVLTAEEYVIDSSAVVMSEAGEYVVEVTYGELKATYKVKVAEPEPETPEEPSEPEEPGTGE